MSIVYGTMPYGGQSIKHEHVASIAGAVEGKLYVIDPTSNIMSVAQGGAGTIGAGSYYYKYTFCIENPVTNSVLGETNPSSLTSVTVTIAANKVISISNIPISSNAHVNARRLYRSTTAGGTYTLLTTINDNTSTTYTDNNSSTTGGSVPTVNTTGQAVAVNVPSATANAFSISEAGTTKFQQNSVGQIIRGPVPYIFDRQAGLLYSYTNPDPAVLNTLYTATLPANLLGTNGGLQAKTYFLISTQSDSYALLRVTYGGSVAVASSSINCPPGTFVQCVWTVDMLQTTSSFQHWSASFIAGSSSSTYTLSIGRGDDPGPSQHNWAGAQSRDITTGISGSGINVLTLNIQMIKNGSTDPITGSIQDTMSILTVYPPT